MPNLRNLFGSKPSPATIERHTEKTVCLHTSVAPQWSSAGDMGHEDRASSFLCGSCGQVFTPAEFAAMRSTEAERVKALVGEGQ